MISRREFLISRAKKRWSKKKIKRGRKGGGVGVTRVLASSLANGMSRPPRASQIPSSHLGSSWNCSITLRKSCCGRKCPFISHFWGIKRLGPALFPRPLRVQRSSVPEAPSKGKEGSKNPARASKPTVLSCQRQGGRGEKPQDSQGMEKKME